MGRKMVDSDARPRPTAAGPAYDRFNAVYKLTPNGTKGWQPDGYPVYRAAQVRGSTSMECRPQMVAQDSPVKLFHIGTTTRCGDT